MEYLASLPEYINSIVGAVDFTAVTPDKVNCHWGDEEELNRYLSVENDDKFGQLLLSGTIESPYPLIWLQTGYSFSPYSSSSDLMEFDNVRIIILCQTNKEWLNKQRWKDNMHKLYGIGHLFRDALDSDIVGTDYNWREYPNYAVQKRQKKESVIIDYCDALILKINKLRINTNCFKYLEHTC